ncbi:MAG: MarC family protein [Paludibacteraceae bacterium]|nr:MarC family protein [Paludibacteraceae bacterium]
MWNTIVSFITNFDFLKVLSAFIVFFPIIDPLGSLPIILNLEAKGQKIQAEKVVIVAFAIMLVFLFAGEWILGFLGVDAKSFAAAGAIVLFLMALEMVCDIEIFKNAGPEGTASIVPLAFPLFAGPGIFTALVAFGVEYTQMEMLLACLLIMIFLYVELKATKWIQRVFGEAGIYIIRKFFGIVLLAISVKLFAENIASLVQLN